MTPPQRNSVLRQMIREIRVYPRPTPTGTAARVVPAWEPEDAPDPGPLLSLEAMPDGIAFSAAEGAAG